MSPAFGDEDLWLQRRIEMREERRRPARPPRDSHATGLRVFGVSVLVIILVSYAILWSV